MSKQKPCPADSLEKRESSLEALEAEVAAEPRDAGPRLRLGQALIAAGRPEEGASHLQLAARLVPSNLHVALLACTALAQVGLERDAALLLSAHVREQKVLTRVAAQELALLESFLQHPEPFVRCHTAKAMGRLGVVQAIAALERRQSDPDGAVRLAATNSLRRLNAH